MTPDSLHSALNQHNVRLLGYEGGLWAWGNVLITQDDLIENLLTWDAVTDPLREQLDSDSPFR